ncbi:MAG: hypothetical protein KF733_03150 [Fimbriimonadaceae bacterium]|nr:MAG: hypothetical protein KF733_03150 [Fimbriimonadaceae bacterium]
MYESKKQPLLPRGDFNARVARHIAFALGIIAAALGIGVLGYHYIAGLEWVDALLDASMILGGMGPVSKLPTDGAKVFASVYALFSGLAFIGIMGVVLAPFAHRIMHRFHVEEGE